MTALSATPKATVVIVNYLGRDLLPPCLDALHRQVDAPRFDTVVVDNASDDGSVDLLARDYPWVRVIASPTNLGFAGGNNLALGAVTTPYAVLLNNDAVPEPDWLGALLAEFETPGHEDVGLVTGKVLFLPRFLPVGFTTPGFRPGNGDTRELGVQIFQVTVNGADVTEKVLWQDAAYGPEGHGDGRFRWTRAAGELLVPVSADALADRESVLVTLTVAADRPGTLTLSVDGRSQDVAVFAQPGPAALTVPAGTDVVDVINNVGGIVLRDGSGADRGFQEIDRGQYDEPAEVFTACGNGMAMRTAIGREIGFFDDDFFMYYEDTDLSWRWRAQGWSIRYTPRARLRHVHSATSIEWSPRWLFHVERNRMLMLAKNGSAALARRSLLDYLGSSARLAAGALIDLRHRRRPALRTLQARVKVILSYARLAPAMLRRRAAIRAHATVSRTDLEAWLVDRP